MEWQLALLLIMGTLFIMMATGLPIAFGFLLVTIIGVIFYWGGEAGLRQLTLSIQSSLTLFPLVPLPLFLLMGEVMFHSGIGPLMLNAVDKLLGRLPGRLGLIAVGGGTVLSTLTGASISSVALLGSVLVPEMEKRGYKKAMSLGPILGSGCLAMMIPPSALAVLLGAIGEISIGPILIAIIIPGLLMAVLYATYIILRCHFQPSIAPAYEVPTTSLSEKLVAVVRYILPLVVIVFLVTGVIILGFATPSEASATGALGTFLLAASYRRLNWEVIKKAVSGTLRITVMAFMIMAAAKAFSQILAASGASRGLIELAMGLPVTPIVVIIIMLIVVLFLGTFVDVVPIMLITLPLFMPVVHTLGFDPVWFAVLFLIGIEVAVISPPFGMVLFVMKGVAPPDTTMGDVYKAGLPFIFWDLVVMALIIAFPVIALWLPGLIRH